MNKKQIRWTEEKEANLKNLWKKGYNTTQIAKKLNITTHSVKHKRYQLFLFGRKGNLNILPKDVQTKIRREKGNKRNKKARLKKINLIGQEKLKSLRRQSARNTRAQNIKLFLDGERQFYWIRRINKIKNNTAKKRNLTVNITWRDLDEQWIKQNGKCFYTGISLIPLDDYKKRNRVNELSIDRIDNKFGYVKGNINFVSNFMNTMKNDLSHKEFVKICKDISNKFT